jgi:hypothetical protein
MNSSGFGEAERRSIVNKIQLKKEEINTIWNTIKFFNVDDLKSKWNDPIGKRFIELILSCELYVNQIDTPDYGSDQYSLIINDGSRVNQIRDYCAHGRCMTVNGGEIGLLSTNDVIINGGIITTIFGSSGWISYIIRNAHITHISTELCAL